MTSFLTSFLFITCPVQDPGAHQAVLTTRRFKRGTTCSPHIMSLSSRSPCHGVLCMLKLYLCSGENWIGSWWLDGLWWGWASFRVSLRVLDPNGKWSRIIPIGTTWLNTKAGGNRSFPRPSLGREEEAECELAMFWLCLYLLSWALLAQQSRVSPSCVLHSGWLWQHVLNRPSKGKLAAGELPGWCIAILLATHRAIIVPYSPCRDVLSIFILCSQRLLNPHVNFSGPNGDGFHPPASFGVLGCWGNLNEIFCILGMKMVHREKH